MLDEQGLDGLTLRAIARRAGVSHGAPLRHFPTLAALLSAVAAQGFRELIAAVDAQLAALDDGATALDRLAAAGRGYVHFAVGSPGVFTVMFRPERLDTTDPAFAARRLRLVPPARRTSSAPRSVRDSTRTSTSRGSRR